MASIEERLLTLPDGSLVLPGHGADTTLAASKAEFAVFKSKPQPADLHGHALVDSVSRSALRARPLSC